MEKIRATTNNLQKLLVVDGHKLTLNHSFEGSEYNLSQDGAVALDIRYGERSERGGEKLMEAEAERVYEFLAGFGYESRIQVYGSNVDRKDVGDAQKYTPYVSLVGDFERVVCTE